MDKANAIQMIARHNLSTLEGDFKLTGYTLTGGAHQAVVLQSLRGSSQSSRPPLLRLQFSCLYAEAFGSNDCDCGQQLRVSRQIISRSGGALIYFTNTDARGLGLPAKMMLVANEEITGLPPLEAIEKCGGQYADFTCFDSVPAILREIGLGTEVTLISNSPQKMSELVSRGIRVACLRTLPIEVTRLSPTGIRELKEKRDVLYHVTGPFTDEPGLSKSISKSKSS